MKASTVLAIVLPVLAVASPATKPLAATQNRPSHRKRLGFEEDCGALYSCLRESDTPYTVDWSKQDEGEFTVDNLTPTCCEKVKPLEKYMDVVYGKDQLGRLVFKEPCTGVTVTDIPLDKMPYYRLFVETFEADLAK
jgi:hypothetical protein